MKKGKSTDIQILNPINYWESKLNINFETEFIRYKSLCTKLTKKERRKLDGAYYITYSDWNHKIITFITMLDQSELDEFKHYLTGCANRSNIFNTITFGTLFPFLVSFLLPYVNNFMSTLFGPKFSGLILFCSFVCGLYCFYDFIVDAKNGLLWGNFYNDIIYIIENFQKSSEV